MYFSTRSCWRWATSGPISVAGSSGSPTCMPPTIGRERVDDLVVVGAAGEDAGLRDARLAVVHERRELQALHRRGEVGVVEDDRGRLAAELEADALELLTADRGDAATGRGGTGERDLVDARVARRGARRPHGRRARVTTPFGMPASSSSSAIRYASSGVSGAGLMTIVQPGQQRRDQLRHRHELRDVPRHDAGDDADRLVAHDDVVAEHAGALLLPRERARDGDERVEHHPRRRRLGEVGEGDAASPSPR